jgi:transcriptional regulator with XRE-family HTH domain
VFGLRKDPATRLRMIMAERDINTQELADRAGVSRATVSSLRTGRTKNPNPDTAYLIAKALGVKTNSIWPNR